MAMSVSVSVCVWVVGQKTAKEEEVLSVYDKYMCSASATSVLGVCHTVELQESKKELYDIAICRPAIHICTYYLWANNSFYYFSPLIWLVHLFFCSSCWLAIVRLAFGWNSTCEHSPYLFAIFCACYILAHVYARLHSTACSNEINKSRRQIWCLHASGDC